MNEIRTRSITQRQAGILLPFFSLPGPHGAGDFGDASYHFIDILAQNHIALWQILPLNPAGYGHSPYQPFSSCAGDELFISIDKLAEEGFLDPATLGTVQFPVSDKVEYDAIRRFKEPYLRLAHQNFLARDGFAGAQYQAFAEKAFWLDDYAHFMTLKYRHEGHSWTQWPDAARDGELPNDLSFDHECHYVKFLQFIFYEQWTVLKDYANSLKIQIVGDIPFYVGIDSVDVWCHQDIFELDGHQPTLIAGVPPDYFSTHGQRWGNPIYRWDVMKETQYHFWTQRLKWNAQLYDVLRLDHFRALDTYWQIPATADTAVEGEWRLGPSYDFMDRLFIEIPDINIIVEDLGELRYEVHELRRHYDLYGMDVIQFTFAFAPDQPEDRKDAVKYTGTHDNQTLVGWYTGLDEDKQQFLAAFLNQNGLNGSDVYEQIINYIVCSNADVAIIPVQDILRLDDHARINTPSTIGSPNWEWKMTTLEVFAICLGQLRPMIVASGRDQSIKKAD